MGTSNHDFNVLQCNIQFDNIDWSPPMVGFCIISTEDSGPSNRIHSTKFLAMTSSWKYLMWVDCKIIWRGSLAGIANKACLGLVTSTIGHSLCFRSTNENIPWSTARRRYLQHKNMPVTIVWGTQWFWCWFCYPLTWYQQHSIDSLMFKLLDLRFSQRWLGCNAM
jgi:hypothetical protein